MMNTGWRAISRSGRPPATCAAVGMGGNWMKLTSTSASSATPISDRYAPVKGCGSRSRVAEARFGPNTPPMMPPASTHEMAFSRAAGATTSAAAKRYSEALAW